MAWFLMFPVKFSGLSFILQPLFSTVFTNLFIDILFPVSLNKIKNIPLTAIVNPMINNITNSTIFLLFIFSFSINIIFNLIIKLFINNNKYLYRMFYYAF